MNTGGNLDRTSSSHSHDMQPGERSHARVSTSSFRMIRYWHDAREHSNMHPAQSIDHTSPLSVPVARYPASMANVVVPDTERDLGEALTTSNACTVYATLNYPRVARSVTVTNVQALSNWSLNLCISNIDIYCKLYMESMSFEQLGAHRLCVQIETDNLSAASCEYSVRPRIILHQISQLPVLNSILARCKARSRVTSAADGYCERYVLVRSSAADNFCSATASAYTSYRHHHGTLKPRRHHCVKQSIGRCTVSPLQNRPTAYHAPPKSAQSEPHQVAIRFSSSYCSISSACRAMLTNAPSSVQALIGLYLSQLQARQTERDTEIPFQYCNKKHKPRCLTVLCQWSICCNRALFTHWN